MPDRYFEKQFSEWVHFSQLRAPDPAPMEEYVSVTIPASVRPSQRAHTASSLSLTRVVVVTPYILTVSLL